MMEKEHRSSVVISFLFNRQSVQKYFNSELIGRSDVLWKGVMEAVGSQEHLNEKKKQEIESL